MGKTLRELNFEQRYGVLILALHRQGENLRENFQDVELTFGDTLLVQGPSKRFIGSCRSATSLVSPNRHNAPFAGTKRRSRSPEF